MHVPAVCVGGGERGTCVYKYMYMYHYFIDLGCGILQSCWSVEMPSFPTVIVNTDAVIMLHIHCTCTCVCTS